MTKRWACIRQIPLLATAPQQQLHPVRRSRYLAPLGQETAGNPASSSATTGISFSDWVG